MISFVRRMFSLRRTSSGALLVSNLAIVASGAITGIITSRVLEPEGRGDLTVLVFWPTLIAAILDLSLKETTIYRTSRAPEDCRSSALVSTILALGCSLVGVTLGFLLLPTLLRSTQQDMLAASRWYLFYIPVSLLAFVPTGILLGLQRFGLVARLRVVGVLVYLLAIIGLTASGQMTPALVATFIVGSTVVTSALGLLLIIPSLRRAGPIHRSTLVTDAVNGAKIGATFQLSRITVILAQNMDRFLATLMLSQVQIGLYQIPATVILVMPVIPNALGLLLFSRVPAIDRSEQQELVLTSYTRTVVLSGLAAVVALPLLPFFVPLLYGAKFAAGVVPAAIATIGAVPGAATAVLQSGARAQLAVSVCIQAEVVGILIMGTVALLSASTLGLSGIALSYLCGRAASLGWMAWRGVARMQVDRRSLVPFSRSFRGRIIADWRRIHAA